MSKVLLLPGLNEFGHFKLSELTRQGFEVNEVAFDDSAIADLYAVSKAPLRNLFAIASMLLKARRIYAKWVSQAQAAYNDFHPDIVVGPSRGGSVAMTVKVDDAVPIVLLAPAYRWFGWVGGNISTKHPNVTIVHSRQDERIPFADSEYLCRKCPQVRLITAGINHSLISPDAIAIWVEEIRRLARHG